MKFITVFLLSLSLFSCSEKETLTPEVDAGNSDLLQAPNDAENDVLPDGGTPLSEPVLRHSFGKYELEGGEEVQPCVQWTLNNEKAIYVNTVTLGNDGSFHHSNWLVVPEEIIDGEDGYFNCEDRGYSQLAFAAQGTVLFAQSTQSKEESQSFPEGVVVKIPPHHRVVAALHLLNLSPKKRTTNLRMELDLVHPKDVKTVVTPFVFTYRILDILPKTQTRFSATCDLKTRYENSDRDLDNMKIYWSLPHYHALGNYFSLSLVGGPQDGNIIQELKGFNAEANGKTYLPAISMKDVTGLRFTCGYNNPRDEKVGWGIGDQEMCVMLGFAEAEGVIETAVLRNSRRVDDIDGIAQYEGECATFVLKKSAGQLPPSEEEIAAPLYIPPSTPSDNDVVVVAKCVDTPKDAVPKFAPTLSEIKQDILTPSCTFSSCHDAENPAFGLDLESPGLHDRLLNHSLQSSATLPLITPGDAEKSWLYQTLSNCEPGKNISRMPKNSPNLLDPGLVGMVKQWINEGAQDL